MNNVLVYTAAISSIVLLILYYIGYKSSEGKKKIKEMWNSSDNINSRSAILVFILSFPFSLIFSGYLAYTGVIDSFFSLFAVSIAVSFIVVLILFTAVFI